MKHEIEPKIIEDGREATMGGGWPVYVCKQCGAEFCLNPEMLNAGKEAITSLLCPDPYSPKRMH